MWGDAPVDIGSSQYQPSTCRRRYGNKENYSSPCVMERGFGPERPSVYIRNPEGIQGKSAILLPRKESSLVRTRRANSRLSVTPLRNNVKSVSPVSFTEPITHKKLVLHFDARNTVLVADTVTQIGVKEAFNSYLTGVTWGYEKTDGEWEWVSDTPSLTAPVPNAITYYKHRERELVRIPSDRGRLRKVTGDFTQEPLGERFCHYLHKGLNYLKWTHADRHDRLVMTDKDGKDYHYILPSVFQLIQHLQDTNRDFSIVIRTYGMDAPNILKAIEESLNGNHPDFPRLKAMPVNHNIGNIKRSDNGDIILNAETITHTIHPLTNEKQIYRAMSKTTGVCAIVDDFQHWQNHDYHHSTSKPHWVDLTDQYVQHIFFDDNLRVTDTDGIVDLRLFRDKSDIPVGVSDLSEMQLYEDACLVQADLLDSTSQRDYFVNKVKMCEDKYENLIKSESIS